VCVLKRKRILSGTAGILAKFSRQILRFLTNLEARYIQFEDWFRKKNVLEHCCILSQDFKSLIRSPFSWWSMDCWWFLCMKNASVFCCAFRHDPESAFYALTKWQMNRANHMHLSGDIACQSWSITARFWTFRPMYWLNQLIDQNYLIWWQSKNSDQTRSSDQPDQTCNHRI
jgi:hypothetical protein